MKHKMDFWTSGFPLKEGLPMMRMEHNSKELVIWEAYILPDFKRSVIICFKDGKTKIL
jgi:hypothetical protein